MSRVTNAILTANVGRDPDDEIVSVNEFLRAHQIGGGEFKAVSEHAGGYKHLESRVYLSAFNHAETDRIVEAVRQGKWRDREMVQLFIKEQEEEVFKQCYCGSTTSTVSVTSDELRIICNALNEVCNGIDLQGEFETRIGAELDEARRLLSKLIQIFRNRSSGHEIT